MKLKIFSKMYLMGFFGGITILCLFRESFMQAPLIPFLFAMVFCFQCLFLGARWSDMETYRQKRGRKVWL